MVGRVLLGLRSGAYGLFVSKPGVSVLTAANSQLLLSTLQRSVQVVAFGAFNRTSGSQSISWPAQGYRPKILVNSQHTVSVAYLSDNSATITVTNRQNTINLYWLPNNRPTLSARCEWFALGPGV